MKTKIFFILTIFVSLACLISSCETVSKMADSASKSGAIKQNTADAINNSSRAISSAAEQITPEQEYYIGRAVAANILSSYTIWNGNQTLTNYLNSICAAITINSQRPYIYNGYHVAILDSNEINAFATSGGHIFVTRGLINTAKSEDALAAVIAHEVAHIQLQHSIKAIRTSRITQALIATGASTVGVMSGKDVNELTSVFNESVGDIFQTMVNNGYSQAQEFAADNNALSLLASAGYNPSGLIDMLSELRTVQSNNSGGFSKTHPSPTRRIANAEMFVDSYKVADARSYRQARFGSVVR
jgi:predicted Zn-dependent protease